MWLCRVTRKQGNEAVKKQIGADTLNDLIEILDQCGYLDEEDTLEIHIGKEGKV